MGHAYKNVRASTFEVPSTLHFTKTTVSYIYITLHVLTSYVNANATSNVGWEWARYTKASDSFASVGANETIRGTGPQIGANGNDTKGGPTRAVPCFFSSLRQVRGLSKRLMHFFGSSLIDRHLAALITARLSLRHSFISTSEKSKGVLYAT